MMSRSKKVMGGVITGLMVALAAVGCKNSIPSDVTTTGEQLSTEANKPTTQTPTIEPTTTTGGENTSATEDTPVEKADPIEFSVYGDVSMKYSSYDQRTSYDTDVTTITCDGDQVTIDGSGATVSGRKIIISELGDYILKGSLSNGQIYVNVSDEEKVHLILSGADLSCQFSAPIYCENADKLVITLEAGTENKVSDALSGTDATAKGCIYSTCDLTLNGNGSLAVNGVFKNGICSDDDLKILGGVYSVYAANVGFKGKDSVSLYKTDATITGSKDGIKSDKEDSPKNGYVFVQESKIVITADDDGLQATQAVILRDSTLLVRCVGDRINCKGNVEGEELITEWK